jgi:hypothetical protein
MQVFTGEVLAGGKMPNLMYMTCHENKSNTRCKLEKHL